MINECCDKNPQDKPILSIIHFNDVYDLQPKGELGGIVNFKAKLCQLKQQNPKSLVLFSGDCLSPSILSNIFKGQQMIFALNRLGIDVACYGNHQFDYQHQHTVMLTSQTNFPWLLGNIKYLVTGRNLGNGQNYQIIQKFGLRIGIFGVVGEDWIGILSDFYQDQLQYTDWAHHSNQMVTILKQQHKCDVIIALTHMRNTPDLEFPSKVLGVDLVLGGHDHVILQQVRDKTPIIKSGCNFRNIGLINFYTKTQKKNSKIQGRRFDFEFHVLKIQKAPQDKIDKQLQKFVYDSMESYRHNDQIIGYTEVDLQTRFSIYRTQQSAYGNFVADLMRLYLQADVSLVNAGSIRNDCVLPAGPLKYSQISNIINDALVVLAMPGKDLLRALQYSIQGLPNSYKGSFLHVSGLTFKYNSNQPPGFRIIQVQINHKKLNLNHIYSVATYSYTSHGGDGYDFFKDCKVLKDQIQTTSMLNLLLKFFAHLNQELKQEIQAGEEIQLMEVPLLKHKSSRNLQRITSLQSKLVKGEDGKMYVSIKPKLQRRIVDIQDLVKENLEQDQLHRVESHKKIQ